MAIVKVVDQTNKEVGEITLVPEVFEVEVRPELLHLVVRQQLAAKRAGTHATKTRGFVSGGGKKPWKQKGTGRARQGSIRSAQWRGGAVIFGPQPRKYGFKLNKKVKRLAMKMALSSLLSENNLTVLKGIELPELKTKLFAKVASDLGLKKALIVLGKEDNTLRLAARNIPGLTLMTTDRMNVYDVLSHGRLLLTEDAVSAMTEKLSGEDAASEQE